MGDPATPTPAEREATRELAKAIVEAVRADKAMPHDLEEVANRFRAFDADDVEELLFKLAQEVELLHDTVDRQARHITILVMDQRRQLPADVLKDIAESHHERDIARMEREVLRGEVEKLTALVVQFREASR